MAIPISKKGDAFTYADYRTWPADERWELIAGIAYAMTPAPGTLHQSVVVRLAQCLANYLEGKRCQVFVAPIDVFLAPQDQNEDSVDTIVQPDVLVVCDPDRVTPRGIRGAPDLVIEILSESTAYRDQTVKLKLYERYGVREYWIINPEAPYVMIYHRADDATYGNPLMFGPGDMVRSSVLSDFSLPAGSLFPL